MRALTANDIYQFIQIGLTGFLVLFVADKLHDIKYNFIQILISPFHYLYNGLYKHKWDREFLEPWNWFFVKNIAYLCFLLVGIGNFFFLIALVSQVRLGQVQDKSILWFIGSPMVTVGVIGLMLVLDGKLSFKQGIFKTKRAARS